jgi:hypothetical protein
VDSIFRLPSKHTHKVRTIMRISSNLSILFVCVPSEKRMKSKWKKMGFFISFRRKNQQNGKVFLLDNWMLVVFCFVVPFWWIVQTTGDLTYGVGVGGGTDVPERWEKIWQKCLLFILFLVITPQSVFWSGWKRFSSTRPQAIASKDYICYKVPTQFFFCIYLCFKLPSVYY